VIFLADALPEVPAEADWSEDPQAARAVVAIRATARARAGVRFMFVRFTIGFHPVTAVGRVGLGKKSGL
jgi:hypothetical protein